MILLTVAVVLLILLTGLSLITGAEFEAQVKAARRWLGRKLMPPHTGEHTSLLREVAAPLTPESGDCEVDTEWRPVAGYEGLYEVSSDGRVRSRARQGTAGGILAVRLNRDGYLQVKLCAFRVPRTRKVHHLVAEAFHGPRPEGQIAARHLDGNRLNNSAVNLAWGTYRENELDKVRQRAARAVPVGAGTGTAPDYAVAHANAMYEASAPYLPEPPEMIGGFPVTYHEPLSVRADRPVTPVRGGHAPWTGAQPVLDDAALDQLDRARWVRSQLPERAEDVTREDMERAIELLRELPPAPVYGQAPVTQVLEAEQLTQVMTP